MTQRWRSGGRFVRPAFICQAGKITLDILVPHDIAQRNANNKVGMGVFESRLLFRLVDMY